MSFFFCIRIVTYSLDTLEPKFLFIIKNLSIQFRQAFYCEGWKFFPTTFWFFRNLCHITSARPTASIATSTASSLVFNPLLLASQPHLYFGNSLSCSSSSISFLITSVANLSSSHAPLSFRTSPALLYIAASPGRLTDFPAHMYKLCNTAHPSSTQTAFHALP